MPMAPPVVLVGEGLESPSELPARQNSLQPGHMAQPGHMTQPGIKGGGD